VIVVQIPEPFRRFRARIPYRAQRLRATGARRDPFRFRWFHRTVVFHTKTDVIRFLYCHEFYHYYLYEVLGRKGSAETACDRFALQHFRSRPRGAAAALQAAGVRGGCSRSIPSYAQEMRAQRPGTRRTQMVGRTWL
jgi:hypothetical protein